MTANPPPDDDPGDPDDLDDPGDPDDLDDPDDPVAGGGGTAPADALETSQRTDASPAATCEYCGRPFASEEAHALHVGDRHADECTAAEREAADAAAERERDELFYFHLRVVAGIAVLYTVIVLLYMIALGSGLL